MAIKPCLTLGIAVALSLSPVLPVPTASAAPKPEAVTVAISAVVDYVDDPMGVLCADVAEGDIITGTYTFDPKAKDSNPLGYVGDYRHTSSPYGISLDVGGQVVSTDPGNVNFLVGLVNGLPDDGSDAYVLRSPSNLRMACGSVVDQISWQLDDPTGKALKNTELKKNAPALNTFESIFGLSFDGRESSGQRYGVYAHVSSAEVVD